MARKTEPTPAPKTHRTIVEGKIYSAEVNKLRSGIKELDQCLEDLLFVVSWAPEKFNRVGDSEWRVAQYNGKPAFRIFFTFDENEVELLTIEMIKLDG